MQNIDLLLNILKQIEAGIKINKNFIPIKIKEILDKLVEDNKLMLQNEFYFKVC